MQKIYKNMILPIYLSNRMESLFRFPFSLRKAKPSQLPLHTPLSEPKKKVQFILQPDIIYFYNSTNDDHISNPFYTN